MFFHLLSDLFWSSSSSASPFNFSQYFEDSRRLQWLVTQIHTLNCHARHHLTFSGWKNLDLDILRSGREGDLEATGNVFNLLRLGQPSSWSRLLLKSRAFIWASASKLTWFSRYADSLFVLPGWSLITIVVLLPLSFSPLISVVLWTSFPPTTPFWQINGLDFPEEEDSEEELVDEVNILSPEEELREDEEEESGFGFWEEVFLVLAVVPSSTLLPGCVAFPFTVDDTFVVIPPAVVSPRWLSQLFVGLISPISPTPDTTELFFDASAPSFEESAPDVDPLPDFLEELTDTDRVLLPCDVLVLLLVLPLTAAGPKGGRSC